MGNFAGYEVILAILAFCGNRLRKCHQFGGSMDCVQMALVFVEKDLFDFANEKPAIPNVNRFFNSAHKSQSAVYRILYRRVHKIDAKFFGFIYISA